MRRLAASLAALWGVSMVVGCGDAGGVARPPPDLRAALSSPPELVELEPVAVRQELLAELLRPADAQPNKAPAKSMIFAINRGGEWQAAPTLDKVQDLLIPSADAGTSPQLTFNGRTEERWSETRSDSLQGLSEREAADLVARALLSKWAVTTSPVQVDRAQGVPYAAAYVDGILRLNPLVLYLAASTPSSSHP